MTIDRSGAPEICSATYLRLREASVNMNRVFD